MRAAAIDIGSSATKACLFDLEGKPGPLVLQNHSVACPLLAPEEQYFEHDLEAHEAALRSLLPGIPLGVPLGFTSAMHGLVLLDRQDKPICNALSWADNRSAYQALALGRLLPGVHARTGTPLHPMAWPSKLLWVKENRPDWWNRASRVTDLKSYLLERLTGQILPLDVSSASATGLWDQQCQNWDTETLRVLDFSERLLPSVASEPFVWEWQGRELHLGAGDGPLGNLGTGAVSAGRIAMSLGTSGAIRTFVTEPRPLPDSLFRYHLDAKSWVEGGAISNGSSVLDWLSDLQNHDPQKVLSMASGVDPGARGLRVYPYFKGERAPFWRPNVKSRVDRRSPNHTFSDLAKATLEGVAFCLNRLLKAVPPATEPLRCTGGMFSSEIWCQLLADVSGQSVAVSPIDQATSLGAALLTIPDYLSFARALPSGQAFEPDKNKHRIYQELFQEWVAGDQAASPNTKLETESTGSPSW